MRLPEPSEPAPVSEPVEADAEKKSEPMVAIKEKRHNGKSPAESLAERPESADAAAKKT
jgi:hypothetical protein